MDPPRPSRPHLVRELAPFTSGRHEVPARPGVRGLRPLGFDARPGPVSTVYLVGDPKQSIYRFRGADMETYVQARDEVRRSGSEPVALDTSFRATPGVVDAHNALFDAAAARPFFTGANAYAPVACGRPASRLLDGDGRDVTPLLALRLPSRLSLPLLGRASRARSAR